MTATILTRRRTLRSFLPILSWLPEYIIFRMHPDTIAALTAWTLPATKGMDQASLRHVPTASERAIERERRREQGQWD